MANFKGQSMKCYVPLMTLLICSILAFTSGCRMTAPIHAWAPPQLGSAVGKQVALSGVQGPRDLTGPLQRQLLSQAPKDPGRQLTMVSMEQMVAYESRNAAGSHAKIQLVSALEETPNDLAVASVARHQGIDYVLRGEVIQKRHASQQNQADPGTLNVSWRLTGLDAEYPGGGNPIVLDVKTAREIYPDLAYVSDLNEVLTQAMVRETFRLITPSVDRYQIKLEIPYLLPGSAKIRRGNRAAREGRWGEAEKLWSEVRERHPTQLAALHNLALAAAAGQDFSRAKKLARKSIRYNPSQLHKQTLVWIELKQRAYHQAFSLPDPPEGWFLTDVPSESESSEKVAADTVAKETVTSETVMSDTLTPDVVSAGWVSDQ